jgi:TRAP transporter TatT component family protein
MLRPLLASACAGVMALGACNLNKLTANATSGMLETGSVAMDRESDLELARLAFPASLKTVETFLISSPKNESLLLLLARGYNSYAFAILEGDLERADEGGTEAQVDELGRRAKLHYLRGREYGFRLLDEPALEQAARKGDLAALDRELADLKKDDVPGLFWATYGWASAINLAKDDPDMLTGLGTIEHMIDRVIALDPDYNSGAPLLFKAVYLGSRPKAFGGKPEQAKAAFERAMAAWGTRNLLVPYLYARIYCPAVQDMALFQKLMKQVLAADVTAQPDLRLNNEVARARARYWSARAEDLILPADPAEPATPPE